jgi:hypothetical protein
VVGLAIHVAHDRQHQPNYFAAKRMVRNELAATPGTNGFG